MNLYLDSSALVKRYITESGSQQVNAWIDQAGIVVTALITRVEVAAAIARVRRMQFITEQEEQAALHAFRSEWESLYRLPISENTVLRGDYLACEHNLKGHDATHLACALIWQEVLGLPVILLTYDTQLSQAAQNARMQVLPQQV
jgi:predicted nucleic acid-binding protein